jgi:homoserine O-acetyltransferase
MKRLAVLVALVWSVSVFAQVAPPPPRAYPAPAVADFTVRGFQFKTGERQDIRIHYATLGSPRTGPDGRVANAVLVLHGTNASSANFLSPNFGDVLFCPGCLLDPAQYFIIVPDNVGHGGSSKPSDGLRASFPHYDYDDMVALQHELLASGLHVDHLRLLIGTSMGCMHSWAWMETYPEFMDAAMPLACAPTEIAGRNRMWRKMLIDGIRADPDWNNGNYTQQPRQALRLAEDLMLLAGSAPLFDQSVGSTRDTADKALDDRFNAAIARLDANDVLYAFEASRNYNPAPKLDAIRVPVMAVNSADDFINPPELAVLEREIARVKHGCAALLSITDKTRGHSTHTLAAVWGGYLARLLRVSGGLASGTSWKGVTPEGRLLHCA